MADKWHLAEVVLLVPQVGLQRRHQLRFQVYLVELAFAPSTAKAMCWTSSCNPGAINGPSFGSSVNYSRHLVRRG